MMTNNIALLQNILQKSKSIIFFGGAGVIIESGIPDFRSNDGLYKQKYKIHLKLFCHMILSLIIYKNFINIIMIRW